MARLIKRVGPFDLRRKRAEDPFKALARSIIYQQLSGRAAAKIFERFLGLVPHQPHPRAADLLAMDMETLRAVGLSRAKCAAIMDLAAKSASGQIPSARSLAHMKDATIVKQLTQVRGIGRWSVEMILIFNLRRLDVLPADDYGVRKGFAKVYGLADLPKPKEVLLYGERWRPFRTVPTWYLWRALSAPPEP